MILVLYDLNITHFAEKQKSQKILVGRCAGTILAMSREKNEKLQSLQKTMDRTWIMVKFHDFMVKSWLNHG